MPLTVGEERRSSNHFKVLFDFAPMGILMTNSIGDIIAINPYALKEFGYKEDEIIHQKIEALIPSRLHSQHNNYRELYFKDPHI
ncbi:MAG: PAS domain-containing protein, partial [Saprospiraceae bacterium]